MISFSIQVFIFLENCIRVFVVNTIVSHFRERRRAFNFHKGLTFIDFCEVWITPVKGSILLASGTSSSIGNRRKSNKGVGRSEAGLSPLEKSYLCLIVFFFRCIAL